jgi:hypothetical protein
MGTDGGGTSECVAVQVSDEESVTHSYGIGA